MKTKTQLKRQFTKAKNAETIFEEECLSLASMLTESSGIDGLMLQVVPLGGDGLAFSIEHPDFDNANVYSIDDLIEALPLTTINDIPMSF